MSNTKPTSRKRKIEFQPPTEEERKRMDKEWEVFKAELDEKMKHYDPVVENRNEIQKQLESGASVFVLEVPKSNRSHCKARFRFTQELGGSSTIASSFRLNLKDLTGERTGERDYWKQPDCFYHVSCVEQMMDYSTLLQNNHLQHEGGLSINHSMYGVEVHYKSVHMAIADWFEHNGSSFDISTYVQCEEAYNQWKTLHYTWSRKHMMHGETDCACGPEPPKPVYSTEHRQQRLLSEVPASIVKIPQIDGIPVTWLEYLRAPVDCTEDTPDNQDSGLVNCSEGTQDNQEAGDVPKVPAEEVQLTRKATGTEIKERREELLEMIRKREEKKREKSRMEEQKRKEERKQAGEYDSSDEYEAADEAAAEKEVAEKEVAEKAAAEKVAEIGKTDHKEQV